MAVCLVSAADEEVQEEAKVEDVDPEKLDYAKGSLCGYCEYCAVSLTLSLRSCKRVVFSGKFMD